MSNPIRFLFDRLTERIFGVIAGSVGNAVSASRTQYEAHQQSQLEDLARQYEADGKQQIADQIRASARAITGSNPAGDGVDIYGIHAVETVPVLDTVDGKAALPQPETKTATDGSSRPRRSRSRKNLTTKLEDTQSGDIDG